METVTMSKSNTEITVKTFNQALSGLVRSIKSTRGKVQALIEFGLAHFAAHSDAIYLTRILRTASETHGLNARGIQAYIQAASNLQWSTDKVGDKVFKMVDKENGPQLNQEVIDVLWFDWVAKKVASNNAAADWTLDQAMLRLVKSYKSKSEEFSVKALKAAVDAAVKKVA
jgi:hypothetical protein